MKTTRARSPDRYLSNESLSSGYNTDFFPGPGGQSSQVLMIYQFCQVLVPEEIGIIGIIMQESRWKPATMSFGLPTGCPPHHHPSPPPHRLHLHHTRAVLLHLTLVVLVWVSHLVDCHLVVGFQPPNSLRAPPLDTVAKVA